MPIYTLLQGKRSILIKKCQKLRKRKTNTKAIILDIVHCYRFKTQMLTFWFLMVTTQWQMLLVHTVKPVGLLVCFVLCCHPSPLSSSLPRPPYSKQRRNYPHPVQLFDAVAFTTHLSQSSQFTNTPCCYIPEGETSLVFTHQPHFHHPITLLHQCLKLKNDLFSKIIKECNVVCILDFHFDKRLKHLIPRLASRLA